MTNEHSDEREKMNKKRSEKITGLLRFLLTVTPFVTEVTEVSYTGVTDMN